MNPLLHRTAARYGFLTLVAVLLLGSMTLVGTGVRQNEDPAVRQ